MKRHTLQAATATLLLAVMAAPILATEMPTEPTAPGQRSEWRQDGSRLSAEQRAERREYMRGMNREERREFMQQRGEARPQRSEQRQGGQRLSAEQRAEHREYMRSMSRAERREFMQQRSETRQMRREQRQGRM